MSEPAYEVIIQIHRGRSNTRDNFAKWEAEQTATFVNSYLKTVQRKMPYCRAAIRPLVKALKLDLERTIEVEEE